MKISDKVLTMAVPTWARVQHPCLLHVATRYVSTRPPLISDQWVVDRKVNVVMEPLRTDSIRQLRVAELVRRGLEDVLLHGGDGRRSLADPRLQRGVDGSGIGITAVALSPDLRIATCYWRLDVIDASEDDRNDKRRKEISKSLHKASGILRAMVGSKVTLKNVPQLRFQEDDRNDDMNQEEHDNTVASFEFS